MKIHKRGLIIPLFLLSVVAFADSRSISESVENASDAYNDAIQAGIDRSERVEKEVFLDIFEEHLGEYLETDRLASLSDEELVAMFKGIYDLLFFSPGHEDKAVLHADLAEELKSREIEIKDPFIRDYLSVAHKSLLEARLFEASNAFSERHGLGVQIELDISPSSRVSDSEQPMVLEISDAEESPVISYKSVDLSSDFSVVIETNPQCHFTVEFIQALEENADMKSRFSEGVLWLVRQGDTLPIGRLLDWNDDTDIADLVVSHDNDDWPREIAFVGSPVFTFFVDGEAVHQVRGWRGDETWSELEIGFGFIDDHEQ